MAMIIVATDSGEVIKMWKDEDKQISDLDHGLSKHLFVEEIADALDNARKQDKEGSA